MQEMVDRFCVLTNNELYKLLQMHYVCFYDVLSLPVVERFYFIPGRAIKMTEHTNQVIQALYCMGYNHATRSHFFNVCGVPLKIPDLVIYCLKIL